MSRTPPGPEPAARSEITTATGWRLVGSATQLVSATAAAGLAAPAAADVLYAARFLVWPRGSANPADVVLDTLTAALAPARRDDQPLSRTQRSEEASGHYHAIRWETARSAERWIGELLWRHPHPAVKGVACTTHVVLDEQPGQTAMTVRVGAPHGVRAVHGLAGAGQAYPAFLGGLNRLVRLAFDNGDGEPQRLHDDQVAAFVRNVLLGDDREYPVVVQAPTEAGEYLVAPETLAAELLGIAHLYVLDRHSTTFRLTDELGDRRHSCYWGAVHAYLPGFSCADDHATHPLLIGDRVVDPVDRAQFRGQLAMLRHAAPPLGVDGLLERMRASAPAPAQAPPAAESGAAPAAPERGATTADHRAARALTGEVLAPILERLEGVSSALERLTQLQEEVLSELVRIRTGAAVRGAGTQALERRFSHLERLLAARLPGADAGPELEPDPVPSAPAGDDAPSLATVVRQAALRHADALLILDDAITAAADSPFEATERVADVLDAMAFVARKRLEGRLGMGLRDAFREWGLDYRPGIAESTSQRLRQQYDVRLPGGASASCTEHIALGASYDPRHCLRIYFTSRAAAESRFVIAHVGRHLEGMTTT